MGSSARQGTPMAGAGMNLPPGWTPQQVQAGGRMQAPPPIPGQPQGIGMNWTTPPPPPPRQQLASMMGGGLLGRGLFNMIDRQGSGYHGGMGIYDPLNPRGGR